MTQPLTLVALAAVAGVMALMGPFGTDDLLGLGPRALYWGVTVVTTYGAGALIHDLLAPRTRARPMAVQVLAAGLATGGAVSLLVVAVNALTFGWVPDAKELPPFLGSVLGICVIVSATLHFAARELRARAPQAGAPPAPAPLPAVPLLDRLPLDKRGALVALSVEDHYVRIRTVKGEDLRLMRLSDAIREVGTTPGAQVHRSHWVAFGQVTAARRDGDRAILTLSTGEEIPVSRANLPRIREAGLLPR